MLLWALLAMALSSLAFSQSSIGQAGNSPIGRALPSAAVGRPSGFAPLGANAELELPAGGNFGTTNQSALSPLVNLQVPIASPLVTNTMVSIQGQTAAGTDRQRQYLVSLGMNATTGTPAGAQPSNAITGDRVTLYSGMAGLPGAANVWAANLSTYITPGFTGLGAAVLEGDLTNAAGDRGDGYGQPSYTAPQAIAFMADSLTTYPNTLAWGVDGKTTAGAAAWNRGFACYNGAVAQACYNDYGGEFDGIALWGAHSNAGIDFYNGNYALAAILFGPGVDMAFDNFSGVTQATLSHDTTGIVTLNAPTIKLSGSLVSGTTPAVSCAAGSVSLSTFTVTNGIVTHC